MSHTHITAPRIDVVEDSAGEMAALEALRDELLDVLAASREPELARELLDGWNKIEATA